MNISPGTEVPRPDLQASFNEAPAQQAYIASIILPPTEVGDHSGAFGRRPLAEQLLDQQTTRTDKGGYPRIEGRLSSDTWETTEQGIEVPLDERQAKIYATYLDFQAANAQLGLEVMKRRRERRVQAICHNTATLPLSGNTGHAMTNEWDDAPNADPIGDAKKAVLGLRARGVDASRAVMQVSFRALWDLSMSAQMLDRLKYTQFPGMTLPPPQLAMALGLAGVIVAGGFYNSADQGVAASIADIWNPEYAFVFVPPATSNIDEPCFGRTMVWKGDGGGDPDMPAVEDYLEPQTRKRVLRLRNEQHEKVLFENAAYLIGNCYTA